MKSSIYVAFRLVLILSLTVLIIFITYTHIDTRWRRRYTNRIRNVQLEPSSLSYEGSSEAAVRDTGARVYHKHHTETVGEAEARIYSTETVGEAETRIYHTETVGEAGAKIHHKYNPVEINPFTRESDEQSTLLKDPDSSDETVEINSNKAHRQVAEYASDDAFISDKINSLNKYFNHLNSANLKSKSKLLIVTYMRSGSSFTGEVLQHHPDVFYMFEPLLMLERHRSLHLPLPLMFINQPSIGELTEPLYLDESLKTLDNLLNCRFTLMDIASFYNAHLDRSRSTKQFYYCSYRLPGVFGIITCLSFLYNHCLKASVTVIKTIRLPMKWAPVLMMKNPGLKVIHLVRDPRATLRSQAYYGGFDLNSIGLYSSRFCQRLEKDVKMAVALKRHKNSVILRYEDLSRDPIGVSQTIFKFIGLDITDNVQIHIINITASGHDEHCALCVSKANSALASQQWRLNMDINHARTVDSNCLTVYNTLGYLPVTTLQDFTDLKISLLKDSEITL
ncbi:carbohydrate sulfotransferase 4 [Patella vulgata]|uniref:carbohydrate sulfotransferase 4 n=1 Tax=Patella vulgata TaxID=6465 RepID=UPI0024A8BFDE|nr:carbohydrate sulfotransferase 4 [Patella vulgata]